MQVLKDSCSNALHLPMITVLYIAVNSGRTVLIDLPPMSKTPTLERALFPGRNTVMMGRTNRKYDESLGKSRSTGSCLDFGKLMFPWSKTKLTIRLAVNRLTSAKGLQCREWVCGREWWLSIILYPH